MSDDSTGPDEPELFVCERCGEEEDDLSFVPLCPDCHWDLEGQA